MGKTIALKLTHQEEQVVHEFNNLGVSNSELLRNALWMFLESKKQTFTQGEQTNIDQTQSLTQIDPLIQDYIQYLKEEIEEVREENNRLHHQLKESITDISKQISRITTDIKSAQETELHLEKDSFFNIHDRIDAVLDKQIHKTEIMDDEDSSSYTWE
ncbi:MAG: hypothetical protein NT038_02600 [Euryarchaeota archaeon]|nr:hypothetical protein [Euryarchaeota archaeon]